jgi:Cu/Ag efflux pump CusA
LLQACFGSWRLASIGFLALPASIVGGLLAAFVSGSGISLGSIVGLLAVLGVAARSSLLLINHYQILREQQGLSFGSDLVVRGARERLPATIASSVAIIAAMLPIVVLGQRPGLEILQPMAIVIIGGLIASTLVTLFVIPALYQVFGAAAKRQTDLYLMSAA